MVIWGLVFWPSTVGAQAPGEVLLTGGVAAEQPFQWAPPTADAVAGITADIAARVSGLTPALKADFSSAAQGAILGRFDEF